MEIKKIQDTYAMDISDRAALAQMKTVVTTVHIGKIIQDLILTDVLSS